MSLLRIIGATVVALSGIYAALSLNSVARQRIEQTESFISLLRFLRSQIECFSLPIPYAVSKCPVEILNGCGYCEDEAPSSARELMIGCSILDDHVKRSVERFFSEVGRGYREEQLKLCDHFISSLEEIRVNMTSQLPMKIKVNSALSIAGAAAVVVLLI